MSISIRNKWFTLVELLIVLSIIGMLAAGLYPSLTGYLARWRDTDKITEVAQLNTAIVLYQVANKTYIISGTASLWSWVWAMNYTNGGSYPKSILTALQEKGFLNKSLQNKDVSGQILSNIAPCTTAYSEKDVYRFYADDITGKYNISAHLENPQQAHITNILLYSNALWVNWICSYYGKNYAVGIN